MKIEFLGAAGTVTGSRYLVTEGDARILIDCGLFQGFKFLRQKNWTEFPIDPEEIDAIILTHAHLDHSGYLPLIIKNGFSGPIFCTRATKDLCSIILPDSGYLQEEEAKFANKHKYSKHHPALPLYTEKDAEISLRSMMTVNWNEKKLFQTKSGTQIEFEFQYAGHLFGAASVSLSVNGNTIGFSGDLGRMNDPVMRPPQFSKEVDYLVIESTYGNKTHEMSDPQEEIAKLVRRTFDRGGTLLIPSFSVGRAQLVLYYLHQLKQSQLIPDMPIYLNSPMATKANEIFSRHFDESRLTKEQAREICATARSVSSVEESIRLNEDDQPKIIIAASGMATGGRVLHHLKAFAPDPKNTILFVGFQAGGTRGDKLVKGAKEVRIHGESWPVRAEVVSMDSMSAHADSNELILWIKQISRKPKKIFVTHGEPSASDALRFRIEHELEIPAHVPEQGEVFICTP